MKKNKTIKISMIFIIISALISIISVNKLTLKEPVFLMNYRELDVYGYEGVYNSGEYFTLDYITNIQDTRRISNITFKEIPDLEFDIYDNSSYPSSYGDISGRYRMTSVVLKCNDFKDMSDAEEKSVTKANVEFDDGSVLNVDLGKIVFFKNEEENDVIKRINGHGSGDGTSSNDFRTSEDLRLEKIESPLYEEKEGVFNFEITSMVYDEEKGEYIKQEEEMKEGSIVTMLSKYISKDILKKYTVYDIKPKVYFRNNEGLEYSIRYDRMSNKPYGINENFEIYIYLKLRGEI